MTVEQGRNAQRRRKAINFLFYDKEYSGEVEAVSEQEVCIDGQWYPLHFVTLI